MADGPAKRSALERVALRLFRRRSRRLGPVQTDDAIHFLNPTERAALRRIQRGAITRAATAGGLCGLASAIAEISAAPLLAAETGVFGIHLTYWLIVGGVTGLATALELGFLYWDSMRSVHRLSRAAGLELFTPDGGETPEALALARAALELPSPNQSVLGIDPHREVSRLRIVAATLLYKAKVSVTNFIFKSVIRRLLGRTVVRAWSAFVAIPVVGLWNAVVSYRVVREARIRIMGPSAAHALLGAELADISDPSTELHLSLLRAVGGSIVRSRRLHPNHLALLEVMTQRFGPAPADERLDDWQALLEALPNLNAYERSAVLAALTIAVIIDGRLDRRELSLLRDAYAAAERPFAPERVRTLFAQFVRGDGVDPSGVI